MIKQIQETSGPIKTKMHQNYPYNIQDEDKNVSFMGFLLTNRNPQCNGEICDPQLTKNENSMKPISPILHPNKEKNERCLPAKGDDGWRRL